MRRAVGVIARAVLCVSIAVVFTEGASLLAASRQETVTRMATLLLEFTHVPSPSQQTTLRRILEDTRTTRAERVIAAAILNTEHILSREDRVALTALMRDDTLPADVRMLATILLHLTHTPTEADKAQLRSLAQHVCRR